MEESFELRRHEKRLKVTLMAAFLLRRFTRNNVQHPVYKAFFEFGKVIKTIFLCRYLVYEDLQPEAHGGINMVEAGTARMG